MSAFLVTEFTFINNMSTIFINELMIVDHDFSAISVVPLLALLFVCCSFFPARLSPFVSILSNVIFSLLIRLKLCRQPQRKYDIGAPTTITVTLPGSSGSQEIERRRSVDSRQC